jgi:UDP-glucose 4-epimerase
VEQHGEKGRQALVGNRLLVTGGNGFIGANLVRLLLDRGYRVTIFGKQLREQAEYLRDLPITTIEGDILDIKLVNEVVPHHDGIVHLAAQTGVSGSLADPVRDCEINVIGTLNILEAARRSGVQRFVFASSNASLGRQLPPATEDKAPLPLSPYGASKLAGEAYCLAYHGSWGIGTVVLRFGNVYGPFSAHKQSVIVKFFEDILTNEKITIDGDGHQTRDFIYVGDLCKAILLALESQISGEVFQIATGLETNISQLAELVQKVMGRNIAVSYGPSRKGDIRKNYSSITKVRSRLGWEPQVSLIDGLRATWEWYRDWVVLNERSSIATLI